LQSNLDMTWARSAAGWRFGGRLWPVRVECAAACVVAVLALAGYLATQATWEDRGVRWDGAEYAAMSHQVVAGEALAAPAPFAYRVGFPVLAALISPADPVAGMQFVSVVSGLVSVLLMWWWLSGFGMSSVVRLSLVALFAVQFHGPLRFGIFLPTNTYSLAWVFLLLGLILFREVARRERGSPLLAAAVVAACFAGTLVRETMVIVPMSMLFVRLDRPGVRSRYRITVGCSLASCVAAIWVTHRVATATGDYEFVSTAVAWAGTKTVLVMAAALFLSFGPMLAVLAAAPRRALGFLDRNRELAALIAISSVLAVVGGTNTELFWYWAAPAVLAATGVLLTAQTGELQRPWLALLLLAAQLVSERAFLAIPLEEEPVDGLLVVFSPLGGAAYPQLWSVFAASDLLVAVVLTNVAFVAGYALLAKASSPGLRPCPPTRSFACPRLKAGKSP